MKHPHLLHIFSATKYVSPFDINMAYEADFDAVIPYCDVELDEVHALTQDTIFSRSTEGVKRTGIFIGGRDFELALQMLEAARKAMVPPFAVSVMADPSGAITTAAVLALPTGQTARAFGALAIGDIKYRVHTSLLKRMHGSDTPVYLALDEAFEVARNIVAERMKDTQIDPAQGTHGAME